MPFLVDTSVLGRLANRADVAHAIATTAHLLTFNVAHFVRLAALAPGIVVVDPASV
jgi:hypothetical protein